MGSVVWRCDTRLTQTPFKGAWYRARGCCWEHQHQADLGDPLPVGQMEAEPRVRHSGVPAARSIAPPSRQSGALQLHPRVLRMLLRCPAPAGASAVPVAAPSSPRLPHRCLQAQMVPTVDVQER